MFNIEPVTNTLGAEVRGIDLAVDHDDETIAKVRAALVEHKVLFFRDQDRLTPATQVAWGRRFGELEAYPYGQGFEGLPELTVLEGSGVVARQETWHSDTSFKERPSGMAMLRAVEIPAVGRDTIWADMQALYEDLSADMKVYLEGKRAVHDSAPRFNDPRGFKERFVSEHPVVRTHPESGRKSIFVNSNNTTHIVGLPDRESAAILGLLFELVHMPDYQVRLRWFPGTVAMWDNRSTNHCLVTDNLGARRVMHRVSIAGDVPA